MFTAFALSWLQTRQRISLKPSTAAAYRSIIHHQLIPYFGSLHLTDLTPGFIQSFLLHRLEIARPKTVLNELICLRSILSEAVSWGLLGSNPAEKVQRPRILASEIGILTKEEAEALLAASKPPFRLLFLTALLTGMRRGELLGLQWIDIDFTQQQIHVRHSLWRGQLLPPKTKTSIRAIDIGPSLVRELEQCYRHTEGRSLFVFHSRNGKPLDGDNLTKRHFRRAVRRAGIPHPVRFHDLRHTNVALRIDQQQNVKYIQNQLGHSSIQTTLDRYGHLMKDAHPEEAAKLDAALGDWLRGQDLNLGPLGYEPNGQVLLPKSPTCITIPQAEIYAEAASF